MDDIPAGMMTIVVTNKNIIKKFPEGVPVRLNKNESVKQYIQMDNRDNLIVFDDMGKAYKILVNNIPLCDRATDGADMKIFTKGLVSSVVGLQSENALKLYDEANQKNEGQYLIVITKNGLIKKLLLTDFMNIANSGLIYSKLDPNDKVEGVYLNISTMGDEIIIYSDHKAIRLSANDIPTQKRNSRGVKAMNTDKVDGIALINSMVKDIVVITEGNRINRVPIDALPKIKKSKSGFNVIKLGRDDKIRTILSIHNDNQVLRIINTEETVDIPVREIPYGSSISPGIKIFKKKLPIVQVTVFGA